MTEKMIVDAATWGVLALTAALGAAANQDWASGHGKVIGAASVLAVVGAALKTFPVFTKAKAASVAASMTQEVQAP